MSFEAKARIPIRPLSYDNQDKRFPKEILADYTKIALYLVDAENQIHEIYNRDTLIKDVVDHLKTETIKEVIEGYDQQIETLVERYTTELTELYETFSDRLSGLTDELNNIGESVTELTENYRTLSETVNKKCEKCILRVTLGLEDWKQDSGNNYYTKTVSVEGITANDYPSVDVELPEDYTVAMNYISEYGKIWKLITKDGEIEVYATEPISSTITLIMSYVK